MISRNFFCLYHCSDFASLEKRMVFWIDTGDPKLDALTIAEVAEERAKLLKEAKTGADGVVDLGEVRFLSEAARLAALAAGEFPDDENK